jgi:SAM-dependent methyltransferase
MSTSPNRIEATVRALDPATLLDVGCGCGRLTGTLARHCPRVIGVDVVPYTSRWSTIAAAVTFCCMDAAALAFPSGSFPLVLERDSLHHIADWGAALAEMARVSGRHLLLQEPVDDLRSPAKRRAHEAQGLLLRLQAEIGDEHYWHLDADALLDAVRRHVTPVEIHLDRTDEPVTFEEFFSGFDRMAARSDREAYWLDQRERLGSRFAGEPLSEDDRFTVLAMKGTHI